MQRKHFFVHYSLGWPAGIAPDITRHLNALKWVIRRNSLQMRLLTWSLTKVKKKNLVITKANRPLTRYLNCELRMRRECRERFPRHRLPRKPLVNDPDMLHDGMGVTHVPWCMSWSITCSGGKNVPGIPGACTTRKFTSLTRAQWVTDCLKHSMFIDWSTICLQVAYYWAGLKHILFIDCSTICLHIIGQAVYCINVFLNQCDTLRPKQLEMHKGLSCNVDTKFKPIMQSGQ